MEGMMKLALKLFFIGMISFVTLVFGGNSDTLYVTHSSGLPGSTNKEFMIKMSNADTVRGMSFVLTDLPESITVTDVQIQVKTNTFRVFRTATTEGGVKVVLIPQANKTGDDRYLLPGTAADLLRVICDVNADAPAKTKATLRLANVAISNMENLTETFNIKDGYFWLGAKGDVDTTFVGVDMFDVLRMIDIVLNRPPAATEYDIWSGDLNGDGVIDMVDIIEAIDLALQGTVMFSKMSVPIIDESVNSSARIDVGVLPNNFIGETRVPFVVRSTENLHGLMLSLNYNRKKIHLSKSQIENLAPEVKASFKYTENSLNVMLYRMDGKPVLSQGENFFELSVRVNEKLDHDEHIRVIQALAGGEKVRKIQTIFGENQQQESYIPETFALEQNYPNPFNMSTVINYDVPPLEEKSTTVRLAIYNTNGQLVKVLEDRQRSAGHYSVQWNGYDEQGRYVASGVYFYKLIAGDVVITKKLAVMK
ncbi:T9SS type A sorting domain-containing protein [candidate division KSB1 bacterium]|nr:T9SS type A sorting domain-containing protein [candidate division KSB1 bacterium]